MKGDKIIIKFIFSSYFLGVLIFVFYDLFAITKNELYFFAVLAVLALTPMSFLQFDSKHLMLRLKERDKLRELEKENDKEK
jgi:hypothetical protein